MKNSNKTTKMLILAVLLAAAPMLSHAATATAVATAPGSYSFSDILGVKIADMTITTVGNKLSYTFDEVTAGYLGDATSLQIFYKNGGNDNNILSFTETLTSSADNVSFKVGGANTTFSSAKLSYTAAPSVTAAVPEPETYAMLLAGLGLMGFVARRRKQAAA